MVKVMANVSRVQNAYLPSPVCRPQHCHCLRCFILDLYISGSGTTLSKSSLPQSTSSQQENTTFCIVCCQLDFERSFFGIQICLFTFWLGQTTIGRFNHKRLYWATMQTSIMFVDLFLENTRLYKAEQLLSQRWCWLNIGIL